jgi:hypothetical protein
LRLEARDPPNEGEVFSSLKMHFISPLRCSRGIGLDLASFFLFFFGVFGFVWVVFLIGFCFLGLFPGFVFWGLLMKLVPYTLLYLMRPIGFFDIYNITYQKKKKKKELVL